MDDPVGQTKACRTLRAIQALMLEDLEATSDEELRAELVEDGHDPELVARKTAETINAAVSEFLRDKA